MTLSQSQRQDAYLRVVCAHFPSFEVVLGQFRKNEKRVLLTTGRMAMAVVWEEKGSDVNLGAHLACDAAKGRMDCAVWCCRTTSDLQRPIRQAMEDGVEVLIVNPHRRTHPQPAVVGSGSRNLRRRHLDKPTSCPTSSGPPRVSRSAAPPPGGRNAEARPKPGLSSRAPVSKHSGSPTLCTDRLTRRNHR